jgi:hypothetical protein
MPLDYWLGFIEHAAGKPALSIVQTHTDETGPAYCTASLLNKLQLPNDHFYALCLHDEQIHEQHYLSKWLRFNEDLDAIILQMAEKAMVPIIRKKIIKDELPILAGRHSGELKPVWKREELKTALMASETVQAAMKKDPLYRLDFEEQLKYLKQCGFILYWNNAHPLLNEHVVVDIEAFHDDLYNQVLKEELQGKGYFPWQENIAFHIQYLAFNDLVFKKDEQSNEWIAPQYLPDEPTGYTFIKEDKLPSLVIRYLYYMPRFLITRFVVQAVGRTRQEGNEKCSYWKYGCITTLNNTRLKVTINDHSQQVFIHIEDSPTSSALLKEVFAFFASYGEVEFWKRKTVTLSEERRYEERPTEPVEVNYEHLEISPNEIDFVKYNELKWAINNNSKEVLTTRGTPIKITKAMTQIIEKEKKEPHKIFFSYSKDDLDILNEFTQHFANLKRQEKVSLWTDGQIEIGKPWDDEIKKNLDKADTVLCLIGPGFMANDYIVGTEIPRVIMRLGNQHIIPVFATTTDIEGSDFDKWQGILNTKQHPKPVHENHCQNGLYWLRNIPKEERHTYYTAIVKELRKRYNW